MPRKQPTKTAAIYARVSTRNGQTTENQLRELRAVAKRHGWKVEATYTDDGVSGAKRLPGILSHEPQFVHQGLRKRVIAAR